MMRIYDPKKVLVPVDFSELSMGVLQAGVEIGRHWDADVKALHVAEEINFPAHYGAETAPTISPSQLREDAQRELESRLETMLKEVSAGPKVTWDLVWGKPVREILRVAESGDFDLIVMATHGRKGLGRLFMGSVAEQVIRRAPCPVFVVRKKVLQEVAGSERV